MLDVAHGNSDLRKAVAASGAAEAARRSRLSVLGPVLFASSSLVNLWLLYYFHNRYWYPTDDGFYAHIAERLLSGEVLNADIQDVHPGYVHFVHALAFKLFGLDMVSLRYPLMAAAFGQACAGYALLSRRDHFIAACGAVAMTSLGVVQFVDPTPNWYSLAISVMLAYWMVRLPVGHQYRLVGAGCLVGICTLFRQPSGAVTAMAVLVIALLERSGSHRGRRLWLARALLTIMLAALLAYVAFSRETEPGGVLLISIWPIAILAWSLIYVRASNADVIAIMWRLAAGGMAPVVPLLLYHVAHGSLGPWITDTVLVSARVTSMPHFGHGWYGLLPLAALYQVVSSFDATAIANGLYWVAVPLLSAVNGFIVLRRLHHGGWADELVLPVIASFYAMVSLYLEGPLYLYFSAGLSLIALLWFAGTSSQLPRLAAATAAVAIAVVAVRCHAGQPRERTPVEILAGRRQPMPSGVGLDRCNMWLSHTDHETYGRLVALIQTETKPDEFILAIPNDAELYFLAQRHNPVRFYNAALGMQTDDDWKAVVRQLDERPPRLVLFRPDDKWNTPASTALMTRIQATYTLINTLAGLDVYRLR
jgi:hypothetical protein